MRLCRARLALFIEFLENRCQSLLVTTLKHGKAAVGLQVGSIVHGNFDAWLHLVKYNCGDAQLSASHGLKRHQGLVDGADTIVDNHDNRQLQRIGKVGIQSILGERRITAAEFNSREDFTVFSYPFVLERPTVLSMHVTHFGHSLDLDRASIHRVER